ncbi:MAG TPA: hypothetical protein VIS48_05285, partial [Candidatus Kryptonia bacterium]
EIGTGAGKYQSPPKADPSSGGEKSSVHYAKRFVKCSYRKKRLEISTLKKQMPPCGIPHYPQLILMSGIN